LPVWLMRLVWKVRGKRAARLHLQDGPSVEGILAGRWGGHYIMLTPSVVEEESVEATGHFEVPAERVVFVQVLS
jgi:hypothetical protein